MDINLIVSYSVSILLLILSIFLLMGKGSFLIAGYNTAIPKQKDKIDKVKLCKVVGTGLLLMAIILMISTYYEFELPNNLSWIIPYGYLAIILVMLVLANTICIKKT